MLSFLYLLILGAPSIRVAAFNDWSVACLEGECSYDAATASIYISGAPTSISDLTTAAGWQILECAANSTAQDIQAVCTDTESTCNHLFQNGAIGTIVRLPENCTTMPFARVAKVWDHENQTRDIRRLGRFFSQDASTNVKGIRLDLNFSAVDVSQNGNVTFYIGAADSPVTGGPASTGEQLRSLLDEDNITSFNQTVTTRPAYITFDNRTVLLDASVMPLPINGHASVGGDVQIVVTPHLNVTVQLGVVAAGTLVPPELTQFELSTGINGMLDGTLQLNTSAIGVISTGSIPLFQIGIPGLDIPGILSIGPTFQIDAEATATVDVGVSLDVAFNFSADNLELHYPANANQTSSGNISSGQSTAQVSLIGTPDATSNSTLTLDLIPGISFGINALDGLADATVNLNLDSFIEIDLVLDENTNATVASNSSSASSPVDGSVNVEGGFNVVASATATLFGLLNVTDSLTLFSKTFELFQKDF